MKTVAVLILLAVLHTLPYWNTGENLAGRPGDPYAHAAIGEWYCKNVVTGDFHFEPFMAPNGVSVAGNYDSPFPFILTCPFVSAGPHFQFHLFSFFQILLIVLSAWALSGVLLRTYSLRWAYVLLTWFCSFYAIRSSIHLTLLSVIWGFQFSLFAIFTYDKTDLKKVVRSMLLLSLALCGTFQNLTALFLIYLAFLIYLIRQVKFYPAFERRNLLLGIGAGAATFLYFWGPMLFFTLTNRDPVFNAGAMREAYSLTLNGLLFPFVSHVVGNYFGFSSGAYENANAMDWLVVLLFIALLVYKKFSLTLVEKVALVIAAFYLYISFGPALPVTEWIFEFYPFKIGRTPSRFAVITHLILIVLTLTWIEKTNWSQKLKSRLGIALSAWAILWGPAANAMWFAPTFKYKALIPEKALAEIKNTAAADSTVVMIPSAWAGEPIYNFLRLFHGQKISSAYLAFPVYNVDMVKAVEADLFLGELDCGSNAIAFKNGAIMNDPESLRRYVSEKGYSFAIINKSYLSNMGGCESLKSWVFKYLKYPWVKVIEENGSFLVTRHL
ncbi:MAG: hypothetical protein K0R29_114 [Pseudobdellovibrio sp.]|jgi:hypothetical protein|nr:hypothetical protein [Pseudobdellovibrio sp.]